MQVEGNPHAQPQQPVELHALSESLGEEDEEESDHNNEFNNDSQFTRLELQLLEQRNLLSLPDEERVAFLIDAGLRLRGFQTIDGDSYPTTTEGDPNDWEGGEEPLSENAGDSGLLSPSPRRYITNNGSAVTHPALPRTFTEGRNHNMNKPSGYFEQSASLRNMERSKPHPNQQTKQIHIDSSALPFSSGQTTSYSQVKGQTAPVQPPVSQNTLQTGAKPFRQPAKQAHMPLPASSRVVPHHAMFAEASAPSRRSAPPPRPNVVPIIHQTLLNQPITEEEAGTHDGDYDQGTLFSMRYSQLRNESFDTNPRAGDAFIPNEIAQKTLRERLDHVQKGCNASQQSQFFESLPTTEWENAGDWFLDQFTSIIHRTKEARQKKRKLAQEFEYEVERRHKHVHKKQSQVEDAMKKMQAQGERLVPRSPKPKKHAT
jgi:hypothetical protein